VTIALSWRFERGIAGDLEMADHLDLAVTRLRLSVGNAR
jgi:hypothetical protein